MLSGVPIPYFMVLIALQNNIANSARSKNGATQDFNGQKRM